MQALQPNTVRPPCRISLRWFNDRTKFRSFKRWQELPARIDFSLAKFVPQTTNRLTKAELSMYKGGDTLGWSSEMPNWHSCWFFFLATHSDRTRFHVKTALALHAGHSQLMGVKAKKLWMEEQKKIWRAKENVRATQLVFCNTLSWLTDVLRSMPTHAKSTWKRCKKDKKASEKRNNKYKPSLGSMSCKWSRWL